MKWFRLGRPRSLKLLWVAVGPVLALAAYVQLTGTGIDLFVLAVGALVLLALERSVGDWLAEWVGPFAAAGMFVICAVAVTWYFLSASLGRSQTDRFFVAAERRGYTTTFYPTPRAESWPAAGGAASSGTTPVATGGVSEPSATGGPPVARASGTGESPRDTPATADRTRGENRRSILSFLRRKKPAERIPTEIILSVEPSRVPAARQVVIRARVRAEDGSAVPGNVEFTVSGLGAGRVALDAEGVAVTTYRTYVSGTYEVRARYAGTSSHATSQAGPALLTVTRE